MWARCRSAASRIRASTRSSASATEGTAHTSGSSVSGTITSIACWPKSNGRSIGSCSDALGRSAPRRRARTRAGRPGRTTGRGTCHLRAWTAGCSSPPPSSARRVEALTQPFHEIDDFRVARRLLRDEIGFLPFHLGFDYSHQVLAIVVGVLFGIPLGGKTLDERGRHV